MKGNPNKNISKEIVQNNRGEQFIRTDKEIRNVDELRQRHIELIPRLGSDWNQHSLVTLRRQSMSRILYYDWIYKKLVGKPGIICEFGVQWGGVLTILSNLRGIYEPYNHQRRIFGFDTFQGFIDIEKEDGIGHKKGDYATDQGYEKELSNILDIIESCSPLSHIKKTFLVKGDASLTINEWLKENPSIAIGLAIFDMDVYKPTYDVLKAIKPRLFKGSILVFDEFSCSSWPGETQALDEVFGISNLRFEHFPHQPNCAICLID